MGTDAWLAGKAADGVVIEVSIVFDRFFVEAWVIWIGCLNLDDGILIVDLVLIFCLCVLARLIR